MLEFTPYGTILRTFAYLYWGLAIGGLVLAIWKGKTVRRKVVWAAIVVVVFGFLPATVLIERYRSNTFAKEAWAYFKKQCDEKSGEKIYKTFSGVKSVLIVKPLPPATEKDLYDQYWYGDPYSDATPWERRAHTAAAALVSTRAPTSPGKQGRSFEFVESIVSLDDTVSSKRLVKILYLPGSRDATQQPINEHSSRFAISWEDISTPEDRTMWVAASRLRVIDLTDNTVIAERIGYLLEPGFGSRDGQRRPWLAARGPETSCPPTHDWADRWFLIKVLNP